MVRIILPERCDRSAAADLLPEFLAAMGQSRIEIDASQAKQVGESVLQLLLSARKSFEEVRIIPSDPFREAARLTGLTNLLLDEEAV